MMTNYLAYLSILITLFQITNALDKKYCDCQPNLDDRIINGERAGEHEIPWQLSLGLKKNGQIYHICGATLLNEIWVLTASHCVYGAKNPNDYRIGFGSNDLKEMPENERVAAKKIITHPSYDPSKATSKGDIALIELERPINLTQNVRPGCLMKNLEQLDDILANQPDTILTASGFGSVKRTYKFIVGQLRGGKIERYLKKADFYAVQKNEANNDCKNRNDLICIKPVTKGDSVCNGDSGGPLQFIVPNESNDSPNRMSVIGVTSFGSGDFSFPVPIITFCNGKAAYTKVPAWNEFINNHIDEDELCMI